MNRALMLLALILGAHAFAQTAPPAASAPATGNKVVLSQGQSIATAVAAMAKAANATVVVDPAVEGTVSAAVARQPLEQGLASIATANHAQWRKVYLKDAEIPRKADGSIDAARLRQVVEAASSAPKITVGVLDPGTGRIAMTTQAPANAAGTQAWLRDKKCVYLLYRPAAAGVGDFLSAQGNPMDAFRNMTPEQRAEMTRKGMEAMLNMDPDVMAQMARESMAAMQNMSPEMKAKLLDMSMKMMVGPPASSPGEPPK